MESPGFQSGLPDSDSPNLHLTHPTSDECVKIWTTTSTSWRDSLTPPLYVQEQLFLTTVPLARNNGMTAWILVEKDSLPNRRRILCSCESFLKRSLMSDPCGTIEKVIVHGIASVFCPPEYRRRGYARRHMIELAKVLRTWGSDQAKILGSVLYSDIGKDFYAKLGWQPNATNLHVEFLPTNSQKSSLAQELVEDDLAELCRRDEAIIRAIMTKPICERRKALTILPDLDHMLWHIGKERFTTEWLFGKIPRAKGAIAGQPGSQVWAIWTHRYYTLPSSVPPSNVLYILRLVVEGDSSANKPRSADANALQIAQQEKQAESLLAVLQHAQAEAAEWRLDHVKLWEPTPWVHDAITKGKVGHCLVEREEDSIASTLWYDSNRKFGAEPLWINNEHYAWC